MASGPLYTLRPAEVFQALETSPTGLKTDQVAARQALYGKNTLSEESAPLAGQRFTKHLAHPLAWLLWIAGGVSLLAGELALAAIIWLLVLVNAVFSFWREHRTEQAMQALRHLLPSNARLLRDSLEVSLPAAAG